MLPLILYQTQSLDRVRRINKIFPFFEQDASHLSSVAPRSRCSRTLVLRTLAAKLEEEEEEKKRNKTEGKKGEKKRRSD